MQSFKQKILKVIKPIIVFIGIVKMPFISKAKVFNNYFEILDILEPGDTILTTSYGHLSNVFNRIFNPGKYMHGSMYVGEINGRPTIVESIGEGVVKKELPLFLSDKDKLAIVKPKKEFINKKQRNIACKHAISQLGKPYDYSFSLNEESLYCTELIYFCYKLANPEFPFVRKYKGNDEVKPNDYYHAQKYFIVSFETN